MIFKKKVFHFEILESTNIKERYIENYFDLLDFVEEIQERMKVENQTGSIYVAKKDDQDQIIVKMKILFPISEDENIEEMLSIFESEKPVRVVKEKKLNNGTDLSKNTMNKEFSISKKNLIITILSMFSILIIISGIFFFQPFSASYETLIQKEDFIQAVKKYPEKKDEIETFIFNKEHEGIPILEKYINETHSKSGEFDLAYLKQNYEKVVSLSEEANTAIRKTALSVSYYKIGDLDNAFKLSQNIESKKLKELIINAYEQQAILKLKELNIDEAKKIQNKIHSEFLKTRLEKVENKLESQKSIKKQLEDTSLSNDKKSELEKQLKDIDNELNKFKKGDF